MKRLEKKVEAEHIVLATLPELSLCILEYAREHGRVTLKDMTILTGASRNTLKGIPVGWRKTGSWPCRVKAGACDIGLGGASKTHAAIIHQRIKYE